MGKAAKLKKLRKLAMAMPAIHTKRVIGEKVQGGDLTETAVEGKPVDIDAWYRRKHLIEVPLNHNRNLKKAYKKAGMQGAAQYANAVAAYVKSKTVAATEPA